MKHFKDIKKKIEWEDFYDLDFDWGDLEFYKKNKLSEEFIREFKDKVDWWCISRYQELSEDFIREFKNRVIWKMISKYQTLSEEFIREFKNSVDWEMISYYQTLSEDFKKRI